MHIIEQLCEHKIIYSSQLNTMYIIDRIMSNILCIVIVLFCIFHLSRPHDSALYDLVRVSWS